MVNKARLRQVIDSQRAYFTKKKLWQKREVPTNLRPQSSFSLMITGVRRAGKSTLAKQLADNSEYSTYIHFDDPRLNQFELDDFYKIEELNPDTSMYCFDEIHQVKDWEKYIRHLTDRQVPNIITGSNATMMSSDLGTLLTGRYLPFELFPFSFEEYAEFKQEKPSIELVKSYMDDGGFPEYLFLQNPLILQQLFKDIIERDIIAKYVIRNGHIIMEMALYLAENNAKRYSLTRLKNKFGMGSTNTASQYMFHLEDTYLFFSLPKYANSYQKRRVNEKKIYSIDTAFARVNSTSLTDDYGRQFENMIYLHLRRQTKNLFYFSEKGECDFIVNEHTQPRHAIQVCWELDRDNEKREINGLLEALNVLQIEKGYLVTLAEKDTLIYDDKTVVIIPAHEFLQTRLA